MKTNPLARLRRIYIVSAFAVAGLTISLTPPTQATTVQLVQNGEFTAATKPGPIQIATPTPELSFAGTVLDNWTLNSGLAFLFGPGTSPSGTNADGTTGAPNHFAPTGTGFCLWGPGPCGGSVPASVQSLPDRLSLGPNGSNFIAMDGAITDPAHIPLQARISQTITGLHVGEPATVTFNWAGGQQAHFTGATTQQFEVSLCPTSGTCPSSDMMKTAVLHTPFQGFSAWRAGSFTFMPTSSTEVLSFLAIGTPATAAPNAGPPFVLLESVKLETVIPEPGTWSLLGIGFAAIAGLAYRRPKWLSLPA